MPRRPSVAHSNSKGNVRGSTESARQRILVIGGTKFIGRFMVDAIAHRDIPVVQTLVLLIAGVFVVVNLMVDLLYAWLDPRISYR